MNATVRDPPAGVYRPTLKRKPDMRWITPSMPSEGYHDWRMSFVCATGMLPPVVESQAPPFERKRRENGLVEPFHGAGYGRVSNIHTIPIEKI